MTSWTFGLYATMSMPRHRSGIQRLRRWTHWRRCIGPARCMAKRLCRGSRQRHVPTMPISWRWLQLWLQLAHAARWRAARCAGAWWAMWSWRSASHVAMTHAVWWRIVAHRCSMLRCRTVAHRCLMLRWWGVAVVLPRRLLTRPGGQAARVAWRSAVTAWIVAWSVQRSTCGWRRP